MATRCSSCNIILARHGQFLKYVNFYFSVAFIFFLAISPGFQYINLLETYVTNFFKGANQMSCQVYLIITRPSFQEETG